MKDYLLFKSEKKTQRYELMMKISVIVPTYKPKDYLWQCLDSLVSQTYPKGDFEVILVLNGCEEPYKSDIEKYISTKMSGMNVNLIHTLHGGVSNARNIALDQAKGEYVTFIDDDDYVSRSYLEELLKIASKDTISLCYPLSFVDGTVMYKSYYITKNFDSIELLDKPIDYKLAKLFFGGPVYKLIHKDVIGDRRFDIRFKNSEDSLFMFLISDKFKYVSVTSKEAIYYRRIRNGSAVTRKRYIREVFINSIRIILSYSKIYFSNPGRYDFSFFVTRCLGQFHIILNRLIKW